MITFLRELIFRDFWLKLFSLVLAVLIWLTVSIVIKKGASPVAALTLQERTFSKLPVIVMSSAQDVRSIRVSPSQVEVTVQGDAKTLHELQGKDVRVIVDLTDIEAAQDLKKRIEVSTLEGISLVRVTPPEVQVLYPPRQ